MILKKNNITLTYGFNFNLFFVIKSYEEMFDDAKYAANEAAATRVRPTLPDKQIQRMSKIVHIPTQISVRIFFNFQYDRAWRLM